MNAIDGHFQAIVRDGGFGEQPLFFGTASSDDGVDWTASPIAPAIPGATVLATNSACVAFQPYTALLSGPNCASLTVKQPGFVPSQASYEQGVYVVVGNAGILTSEDGLDWNLATDLN